MHEKTSHVPRARVNINKYDHPADPTACSSEVGPQGVESPLFLLTASERVMSEAAYKAESDPDPAPASSSGGEASGGAPGPLTIDTTYPRSIEGILKIVTVVSGTSPFLYL